MLEKDKGRQFLHAAWAQALVNASSRPTPPEVGRGAPTGGQRNQRQDRQNYLIIAYPAISSSARARLFSLELKS